MLNKSNAIYKPFHYPEAYEYYKKHEQMHWLPEEVPMQQDVFDWKNTLSDAERNNITHILRFFTQGDIDVAGAYIDRYLPFFKAIEVRMMLSSFANREAVHIDAYSHLIDTLAMPETTYSAFLEYDAMAAKQDFLEGFTGNLATEMACFSSFTEGMMLFSSFIILLNYTRHGKMRGMGQIIAWSIKDETVHFEAMTWLFRKYIEENKHLWNDETKKAIYETCRKMVELEDKFIDLAFELGGVPGLTPEEVKLYIRYLADRRLISLGLKGNFGVKKNPCPWVEELINAPKHTNFFENREVEYARGALTGDWNNVWAQ